MEKNICKSTPCLIHGSRITRKAFRLINLLSSGKLILRSVPKRFAGSVIFPNFDCLQIICSSIESQMNNLLSWRNTYIVQFPLIRTLLQGNVFTPVCQSVHRGTSWGIGEPPQPCSPTLYHVPCPIPVLPLPHPIPPLAGLGSRWNVTPRSVHFLWSSRRTVLFYLWIQDSL